MTAQEIRDKYLDLFKARGHAILPSASLIPENDPSTLFTSSGMQPLIPYLMGEKHPAGQRLADIQKCIRVDDIEEVGDKRHTTCFEMLGNWSLGDYFKKEQLSWFFRFLTAEMGFDPKRLYVTVYSGNQEIGVERDAVSVSVWKDIFAQEGITAKDIDNAEEQGLQDGRIFYYPDKKNWWSRSGPPDKMPPGEIGGPDSEVFYDMGVELRRHENSAWQDRPCHLNCDCGRFIEVGNSVFIEFIKTADGFSPLPQKNVDFGGGLERVAMIAQGKDNIFETDLYINIISRIESLSGRRYREHSAPFEVIADHLKGAVMIMGDDKGIAPANTDQGYIVRRLIRRAIRYGRILGIKEESWTKEIAAIVIKDYGRAYPELERNAGFVTGRMAEEEEKFMKTLEKGEKQISGNRLDGQAAFNLFQTYGYPLEMTKEIAAEKNIVLSPGFDREFADASLKHQELSRTASAGKFKGGLADNSADTTRLHTAAHLLLEALRRVLGPDIHQKGSNITAERLRFDFSYPEKLTAKQKEAIEAIVNSAIEAGLPVAFEEMDLAAAKACAAEGVFDSKYGDKVKVYAVGAGENIYSREICGGPHVENTKELGRFKIKKEESSSAGVRRIKAVLE